MKSRTLLPPRPGSEAEAAAQHWLEERGLVTIARNWHCRHGEIDLVMHHGDTLVFVEVRLRNHNHFGSGGTSVTAAKQARLWRTASLFLASETEWAMHPCRFDVISARSRAGHYHFEWITNAFYGD